ncbi:DUF6153 family protein [Streptomyces sp. NPDC060232]|uniref:DUF6153 family protein n=1 Tax=Streptomyces sp. NPDC060232 TaxID=3347079 RepID=UPI0036657292
MTHTRRPTHRRPSALGAALQVLVLAVLAGILGMHALGPAPARAALPPDGHHAMAAGHGAPAAGQTAGDCSHPDGGSGHSGHADATCAAAGIASGYTPPALSEALVGVYAMPSSDPADPPAEAGARAPPDLAELQLLRI